jgi:hypothetical protein
MTKRLEAIRDLSTVATVRHGLPGGDRIATLSIFQVGYHDGQ